MKRQKWKEMQAKEERIAIGEEVMQKAIEAKYVVQVITSII